MMDWDERHHGWNVGGGAFLMGLLCLIAVVIVIWAVISLLRQNSSVHPHQSLRETPREILDRRLANGEVDAESYAQARKLLDGR